MRLIISGDNFKVNDRIRGLIEEKFLEIDRVLPEFNWEIKTADVRIKKDNQRDLMISFDMGLPKKRRIHAEVKGQDLNNMIIELEKEVEKQIKRYKEEVGITDKV